MTTVLAVVRPESIPILAEARTRAFDTRRSRETRRNPRFDTQPAPTGELLNRDFLDRTATEESIEPGVLDDTPIAYVHAVMKVTEPRGDERRAVRAHGG